MTRAEYEDWRQHPVTQHLTQYFTEIRDDMVSALSNGHTLGENTERATALMVGEIAGLNYFIKNQYDEEDG